MPPPLRAPFDLGTPGLFNNRRGREIIAVKKEFWGLLTQPCAAGLSEHTRGFVKAQADIRAQLGSESYLLDRYLDELLRAINIYDAHEAAQDGLEKGRELVEIIKDAMGTGNGEHLYHPFYTKAKSFVDKHKLPGRSVDHKCAIYYLAMADAWREFAVCEVADEYTIRCITENVNQKEIETLYNEIAGKINNPAVLEELLEHFAVRHFAVLPIQVFSQGLATHLNYEMAGYDHEDTTSSYRLWLDSGVGSL